MIFPFLPRYVEFLGSSYGFSIIFLVGAVFSAQAVTMALAAPVWGAPADRFGKKIMVQRAMFGGAVMIFLMAFSTSAEMLVVLRALQGLVTGTVAQRTRLWPRVRLEIKRGTRWARCRWGCGAVWRSARSWAAF